MVAQTIYMEQLDNPSIYQILLQNGMLQIMF